MKTIYKYAVPLAELDDVIPIEMPLAAKVLSVENQKENLCIWAEVDTTNRTEPRLFRVAGTGHPLHVSGVERGRFIGTVMFADGKLVFHIYEAS